MSWRTWSPVRSEASPRRSGAIAPVSFDDLSSVLGDATLRRAAEIDCDEV